jgi:quercetin dioxygenase-like cupin family protein
MAGGPVWGAESADLNATLLEWPAGEGPPEHVNESLDVLYVVVAGSATLTVDGAPRDLEPGEATIVDKGARRALVAGPEGVRYLTAHKRRGGLQLKRF